MNPAEKIRLYDHALDALFPRDLAGEAKKYLDTFEGTCTKVRVGTPPAPDGKFANHIIFNDGTIGIFDAKLLEIWDMNARVIRTIHIPTCAYIAIQLDNRLIAIYDGNITISVCDFISGEHVRTLMLGSNTLGIHNMIKLNTHRDCIAYTHYITPNELHHMYDGSDRTGNIVIRNYKTGNVVKSVAMITRWNTIHQLPNGNIITHNDVTFQMWK